MCENLKLNYFKQQKRHYGNNFEQFDTTEIIKVS